MKDKIDQAPTPQNTPASAAGSYMPKSSNTANIPDTINEVNPELLKNLLSSNPLLLASIQNKLGTLIGNDSGYLQSLSPKIKNRVKSLKGLQFDIFKIEADFQIELFELEKKFNSKFNDIYDKREKIITGEYEPTQKEIDAGELEDDEDEDEDEEQEDEDDEEDTQKGIPFFWLTAMQSIPPVQEMINERDSEVLENLTNVSLKYLDVPGFKLIFKFKQNDYFQNKELVKTYYYQKELGYSGEFIYDHAEGTEIQWSDNNHNVTVDVELRKQRNKHTKQVRTIEKTTPTDSFFNFFNPPKMPDSNGDENDEDFEDIDEELEENLQLDYSIGELIKEKLIPRAIDWFTGDALQYEPEFAGEEDEGDFDDDEDDEDDDEEGDEDEEDEEEEETEGSGSDDDDEDNNDGKQKPECNQQ